MIQHLKLKHLVTTALVLALAVPAGAGVTRVDISPATVVSLDPGRAGAAMGGAVSGDIFFAANFAFRTTIGFTKDRYFPENRSYNEADYGFWLSLAPYAETSIGSTIRPYAAVLGSFSTGRGAPPPTTARVVSPLAPAARLSVASTRENAFSLGATLGSKFHVSGPVSLFAEVTHFFYTGFIQRSATNFSGLPDVSLNYDFDENPTYLSIGLSYSLTFGKD